MSQAALLLTPPAGAPSGAPRLPRGPWLEHIERWDADGMHDLRAAWWDEAARLELEQALPRDEAEGRAYRAVCRAAGLTPEPWLPSAATASGRAPAPAFEGRGSGRASRPIVHPCCCGGCGCVSLTEEGRGPCWRCGWSRREVRP